MFALGNREKALTQLVKSTFLTTASPHTDRHTGGRPMVALCPRPLTTHLSMPRASGDQCSGSPSSGTIKRHRNLKNEPFITRRDVFVTGLASIGRLRSINPRFFLKIPRTRGILLSVSPVLFFSPDTRKRHNLTPRGRCPADMHRYCIGVCAFLRAGFSFSPY